MSQMAPLWRDRQQAGRALAERLRPWADDGRARGTRPLVIGLPRGGVPVAAEVAQVLHLPLASWAVRKLAHPAAPEVAIGAIAPGGVLLWDEPYLRQLHLDPPLRRRLVAEQDDELRRRQRLFGDPAPSALRGRDLLVVDDGVATGLTVRAAVESLRQCGPARLVLAVPVIDRAVATRLRPLVDGLEALAEVQGLMAVGAWYERFDQLDDAQVQALLTPGLRDADSSDPASSGAGLHWRGTADRP
ncbi:MAG: phosphoribosyltransferase [Synechococcaceae bacterium WB8_1B_136]|nr:phosphoribosyltransferase [Synechococcaceae bacterium WB8_1B_136]